MEELVNLIVKKTGISKDQAKAAVDMVVKFLKQKLPAPIAGQIDSVLSGTGSVENVARSIGGIIGKKKS